MLVTNSCTIISLESFVICHSNCRVSICYSKSFHIYIEDQCCVVSFMVTFKQIEQWEEEEWPELLYIWRKWVGEGDII